jgi:hypothetical protein
MEGPSSSSRHHVAATIKIPTASHRTLLTRVDSTHPIGITPDNGIAPNYGITPAPRKRPKTTMYTYSGISPLPPPAS